mmetsp:Transcript_109234/g.296187  ORF Transcript_109234/g.296187 Transcript_109234/m.296187 type:complete len:263 (+) Transcript_109234:303-1091(+)
MLTSARRPPRMPRHRPLASSSSSSSAVAAEGDDAGLACDWRLPGRRSDPAGPLVLDAGLDDGGVGVFAFGAVAAASESTSPAAAHARCGGAGGAGAGCSGGRASAGSSSASRPPSTRSFWAMRKYSPSASLKSLRWLFSLTARSRETCESSSCAEICNKRPSVIISTTKVLRPDEAPAPSTSRTIFLLSTSLLGFSAWSAACTAGDSCGALLALMVPPRSTVSKRIISAVLPRAERSTNGYSALFLKYAMFRRFIPSHSTWL